MNAKQTRPSSSGQSPSSTPPSGSAPEGPVESSSDTSRTPRPQSLGGLQRRRTQATRETGQSEPMARLVSLDAYRGFIMIMLAAAGFGIASLSSLPEDARVWQRLDYQIWQDIGFHFRHPEWQSNFALPGQESPWLAIGVSFWDLIQPAFMFMVGVAMPYSYARRAMFGHSAWRRAAHAAWRALVLVLLGVFLSSTGRSQTNWVFVNVLCQIGLGYLFVYALLGRKLWIQMLAFAVILAGYWGVFYSYTPPEGDEATATVADEDAVFEGTFAHWSKHANAGHAVDVWLLNQFPRAEEFEKNEGGYVTLNFVPSIGTMLLGVFCGQLLRSGARWWQKFLLLVLGGAVCMALAMVAAQYACPIVKRIWTPSWVLFSGGWVIWMLAAFYLVFDLCRLRWLAIPLVIVGMNSIVMYLMGQLLRPWAISTVKTHFLGLLQHIEIWTGTMYLADDLFGRVIWPASAFIIFWLIALWMYRQKYFVRI